jgi:TatD DNase family protein
VAIHPNETAAADGVRAETLAEITSLASSPKVVAIGETGLDYYRHHTPPARQREAFDWHLRLAAERQLPVIVHNRQADADIAPALEAAASARHPAAGVPAILHCFSSDDPDYLERMLAAGCCVSFAGPLTFKNGDGARAMAARVPLDRLLVETDCPYMAPVPHRGQRNEPAFVRETAAALAAVHHVSFAVLETQLWHNSVRVVPAFGRHLQEVG